ncbi:hypothetical protein LJC57_05850 [Parabacteroides sp. OttesenSCG-928-G07]|nr:hypothetical protein [Parabacteroides sp. OttesenSCG-928-G21]MDL2278098.1 hypothetical protein [Parabacteroides sp. OttesenSCG-928-G07]
MDNAGDWLYIILLAVAGISGLFSSARKKKEQSPSNHPHPETNSEETASESKSFWETFEEMQQKETPANPPTPTRKQIQPTPLTTSYDSIKKEGARQIKQESFFEEETIADEKSALVPDNLFQDVDELKKAVLFSEILNRKY